MAKTGTRVSFTDLEILRAALNSALHQNTVLDLAEQYRKLSSRPQASPMTKALERAYELVEVHLEEQEPEEEPADE